MNIKVKYEFQCPKCGRWADENSLVYQTPPEYNHIKALEFGGNPMDWTEMHTCPECQTDWAFNNSNC